MPDRSLYLPFPEFVDGRPGTYRIADSTGRDSLGSVDRVHRKLWVPLRIDGQAVMRHELAHVHWSPEVLPEVDYPIVVLHCVEDARINLALEHLPLPVQLDPEQRTHVQLLALRDRKSGRAADFALRWVASLGTNAEADLAAIAEATGDESSAVVARLVARARERLEGARAHRVVAPFGAALVVASELARALAARAALDPQFAEITLKVECCVDEEAVPRAREVGESAERPMRWPAPPSSDRSRSSRRRSRMHRRRPAACGAVGARRPRARSSAHCTAGHSTARCSGVRSAASAEAFSSTRAGACTSAKATSTRFSMPRAARRWSPSTRAPAPRASSAWWRAPAAARHAEYLQSFGRGNIVDEPALHWLAQQPAPRFWVSDGHVTGIGDRRTPDLARRCAQVCRAARIRRFATAADAARGLASGARGLAS